ncbi:hypothetical protein AA0X95_06845 [Bacillus sp. 1P10SD]|uniref:hypothetical protein n=1 Tax=Bacillus sp. 1P10SD TaxID=3132265 RepID=UPI0039A5DB3C
MTLIRFNLPMFIGGIMIILLNTIIFNYQNPSIKTVFFTAIIPFIILFAISAYFFYERVVITNNRLEYRTFFKKPIKFQFQEIDSLRKKKVETAIGSDGIINFHCLYRFHWRKKFWVRYHMVFLKRSH